MDYHLIICLHNPDKQEQPIKLKAIGKHMRCRKCIEWDVVNNICNLHHIDHLTDDHVTCIDFHEVELKDMWYDDEKDPSK